MMNVEIVRVGGMWNNSGVTDQRCDMCHEDKPLDGGQGWGASSRDSKPYDGASFCPECMAVIERGEREEIVALVTPIVARLMATYDDHEDDLALEFLGELEAGAIALVLK